MDKFHSEPPHIMVIDQLHSRHITDLMRLYQREFWCNARMQQDVETILASTDIVIGLENRDGQLVGFCRLLTDFVYKATLYDLIVDPVYRGQGLGDHLMKLVIEHPDLSNIQHIDLHYLAAMTAFYQCWEFSQELNGLCHMRRFQRGC